MKVRINPDKCIACTTCVAHCPVARVTPKFLGPRMIGPAYERFRLLALAEDESLTYCANCKNCDITCPQGVPVSSINMLARAEQARKQGTNLRDWVLAHGELQAKLLQIIPASLKNFGMLNPVTRYVLDQLGIDKRAPLPAFAKKTFRQAFKKIDQGSHSRKVVFFPGCYVDVYDPQTGLDMVWAFNKAGYEVISPDEFGCCGLPMIANGFWEDGKKRANNNLAELAKWREQGITVVTGCPSCALIFRDDIPEFYPELVEKHGLGRLEDAQDFLMECVERGELDLGGIRNDTEHKTCQCQCGMLRHFGQLWLQKGKVRYRPGSRLGIVRYCPQESMQVCFFRMRHLPRTDRTWQRQKGNPPCKHPQDAHGRQNRSCS